MIGGHKIFGTNFIFIYWRNGFENNFIFPCFCSFSGPILATRISQTDRIGTFCWRTAARSPTSSLIWWRLLGTSPCSSSRTTRSPCWRAWSTLTKVETRSAPERTQPCLLVVTARGYSSSRTAGCQELPVVGFFLMGLERLDRQRDAALRDGDGGESSAVCSACSRMRSCQGFVYTRTHSRTVCL